MQDDEDTEEMSPMERSAFDEAKREYDAYKQTGKLPPGTRIHTGGMVESLGKGNWGIRECEAELPGGKALTGSIQSDGDMHALETFEEED